MKVGWVITPFGWLFLALLLAAAFYFFVGRLRRPPEAKQ